jgi:hypothetical protein
LHFVLSISSSEEEGCLPVCQRQPNCLWGETRMTRGTLYTWRFTTHVSVPNDLYGKLYLV